MYKYKSMFNITKQYVQIHFQNYMFFKVANKNFCKYKINLLNNLI